MNTVSRFPHALRMGAGNGDVRSSIGSDSQQRSRFDDDRDLLFALREGNLGGWWMHPDGTALDMSETFWTMLGLEGRASTGDADFLSALHEDDRSRVAEALRRWSVREGDDRIAFRIVRPDGEKRWMELRRQPFPAAGEPERRLAGVAADLTDQCRNERLRAALVAHKNVFRDVEEPSELLEGAAGIVGRALSLDLVAFYDVDPTTALVAPGPTWTATERMPALCEREIASAIPRICRGEPVVVDRLSPRVVDDESATSLGHKAGNALIAPLYDEAHLSALLVATSASKRSWRQDERAFVQEAAERSRIGMTRLMGERKFAARATSLEEQVAARTAELHQAEASLRHAQKMEAIGQLTGSVAHDFNNLLTVIRSATDLLKQPELSVGRHTKYLDAISETVDRAARLTGQLLAFARRQTLTPELFDVGRDLTALTDMLGTLTGAGIEIDLTLPDQACLIYVDQSQFDTALVNLVVNAKDAMGGQGRLCVAVRAVDGLPPIRNHPATPGKFVEISVSDTGTGIARDLLEQIFEPFFTTKDVGKGTGLGLSQVFGFVKQSGGNVAVESMLGQGTRFSVYLPEAAGGRDDPAPPSSQTAPDAEALRVLLVEDDVKVGGLTDDILSGLGHRTTWIAAADAALIELDRNPAAYDVVFSDVVMPHMSGIELGRTIRRRHPQLPVVLASGYSDTLAQDGPGGFAVLRKPYSTEQLAGALRIAVATRGVVAR